MTERHLRIFMAVVENGGMSAAARELYITQPSVSAAVGELEEHYGVKLFERIGRRLVITAAGEKLIGYARRYLACGEDMERAMRNASDSTQVTLGATLTVGGSVMGTLVRELENKCGDVRASVLVENTAIIERKLITSELDMALIEGEVRSLELITQPIMQDEMLLICSPDSRLAAIDPLRIADLAGEPFIMREPGSGTRELFERALAKQLVRIEEKWTCSNVQAIFAAVRAGCGAAVLSRRLIEQEKRMGEIAVKRVENASLRRTFDLCYHKDKYLSRTLKTFAEICTGFGEHEKI